MTKLSPAAQAVLGAAMGSRGGRFRVIAAIRAAVDQVVPEHREHHPATLDERHRKVSAFSVRDQFLAIATELEGQ